MLNVGLTVPKSAGNSSLYALSFIFSNTLKGPAARGINLDLRKSGKRSLRKCNQTKSPTSNTTCFLPLSPASLYLAFMCSMLSLVVLCKFNIISARCVASKLFCTEEGKGNKSIGARGTKPYMMGTSLLLIQPLYLQLHTYKEPSQDLVPNNLTIRYFRFLELFLIYMRI